MDHLERLDKVLDTLEKDAVKIDSISNLSRSLAEMADEIVAEKRDVKDAANDVKNMALSFDSSIKSLGSELQSNKQSIEESTQAIKNQIETDHKEMEATILELVSSVSKNQADLEARLQEINDSISEEIEDVEEIRASLVSFYQNQEKTNKLHTALISIALVLSLAACIIPFIK